MKLTRIFAVLAVFATCAMAQPERPIRVRPEKKEPVTQALEVLRDPPSAIAAETARLTFQVSPLSSKGLLSQQVRDALKAIDRANGDGTLIKIRAFVSGTGDLRRVQQIVSEDFAERKLPLPAVSTIQVGGLPLEGAQVVIEAVSQDRRQVNPNGLAFFSGGRGKDAAEAVKLLQDAAGSLAMVRVTCFLHSLEEVNAGRRLVAGAFASASANLVQLTRLGVEPVAACEGVGKAAAGSAGGSRMALLASPKIVFTGLHMAFRSEDADLRLAFERLRKSIQAVGGMDVAFVSGYALTRAMEQKSAAAGFSGPGTMLLVEGLPSLDATFGVEAVGSAQ